MSRPDPPCVHPNTSSQDWDSGRDPDTGYHDAGTRVTCLDCGEIFDEIEYRRELDDRERDRNPHPGDTYAQFDHRLLVVDAGGDDVYVVCRHESYSGPLQSIPLETFRFYLNRGLLTRVRDQLGGNT